MRLKKKTLLLWVSVTVIFSIIGLSPSVSTAKEEYIEGSVDVIDGGATRVGDEVIKLYNVIAPSARQKCRKGSMPWLCGAAARKHLAELTSREILRCLKVGNYHGQCFIENLDIAKDMVRSSWAIPDNVGRNYHGDEELARTGKLVMWKYMD